jgi:hypothetical protein
VILRPIPSVGGRKNDPVGINSSFKVKLDVSIHYIWLCRTHPVMVVRAEGRLMQADIGGDERRGKKCRKGACLHVSQPALSHMGGVQPPTGRFHRAMEEPQAFSRKLLR